jgi:hypothetical protein
MLGGGMLQQAVDDADPVEPGRDGEAPGDGGGLEPVDLLHPPDVQLQATLNTPGQVAAQIGLGVITGGALEPGQVGGHRQPQLISDRHQMIGRDGRQFGEGHHVQTLRPPLPVANPANAPGARKGYVHGPIVIDQYTYRLGEEDEPAFPAGHRAGVWGSMGGC